MYCLWHFSGSLEKPCEPWNHSQLASAPPSCGQPHDKVQEQNSYEFQDHLKTATNAQIKCLKDNKHLGTAQLVHCFCSVWSKECFKPSPSYSKTPCTAKFPGWGTTELLQHTDPITTFPWGGRPCFFFFF